jgi:hypothetical protein
MATAAILKKSTSPNNYVCSVSYYYYSSSFFLSFFLSYAKSLSDTFLGDALIKLYPKFVGISYAM